MMAKRFLLYVKYGPAEFYFRIPGKKTLNFLIHVALVTQTSVKTRYVRRSAKTDGCWAYKLEDVL